MSEKNKEQVPSGVTIIMVSIISFFILAFIGMFMTGDTAYKIQSVTEEFQNLYLIKDNVDLVKKMDDKFSVDKIHKVQNNLSLHEDDPKRNKSTS